MRTARKVRVQILKAALNRLQTQNKGFSMRAFAQKLGVSPSFVSRVMNEKADLPFDRIEEVAQILRLDKISQDRLLKSYADERTLGILHKTGVSDRHEEIMSEYIELASKQHALLLKWYYIAILDLAASKEFSIQPEWLARKLGLRVDEAQEAASFLKAQKFLVQTKDGLWKKSFKNIRFPTKESLELIRSYHAMMMKQALKVLREKKSQKDFDRRLIAGLSMAANPAQLSRAVAKLNEAVFDVAKIMSTGDCSEVYHLGFQFFPVTEED